MSEKTEADLILEGDVPKLADGEYVEYTYQTKNKPNAHIFIRDGQLHILTTNGGWLSAYLEDLDGDLAPWAG